MIDIETYAEQIVVSVPSKRVAFLIDEIRDNMLSVNKKTEKMEPVLNEEKIGRASCRERVYVSV